MIMGAYWMARPESREQAANRLSRFLGSLAAAPHEPALGQWFLKRSTTASARTRLPTDPPSIAEALRANRRDVDGGVIPELGHRLSVWNGDNVSFEATIGSSSPHVSNAAVLSFVDGALLLTAEQWRALLQAAVSAFEPEHGVVASHEQLQTSNDPDPWALGWFTYDRRDGVRQHGDR
jgi:hypothetical protein